LRNSGAITCGKCRILSNVGAIVAQLLAENGTMLAQLLAEMSDFEQIWHNYIKRWDIKMGVQFIYYYLIMKKQTKFFL
jgi:hypothetical protein